MTVQVAVFCKVERYRIAPADAIKARHQEGASTTRPTPSDNGGGIGGRTPTSTPFLRLGFGM